MKKICWIVFFFLALGSCLDDPDCINMSNGFVGISFKKMFDGKADTVVFIGIQSPGSDSIFYQFSLATSIALPLSPFTNQAHFALEEAYDENFLEMTYINNPVQYVSEDCGTRYNFSDLEFTDHDFDSVKVVTNTLVSSAQTNLEVYRCPRTNFVKLAFRQLINAVEKPDTVYFNNISADFPIVIFIPNDTLSYVNLPLNENAPTTTFIFDFKDGSSQRVTFDYTRTPWNEFNTRCGTLTLFSDLNSTAHDFSTIEVRRDSIQDPPLTNVAIFK